MKKYLLDFFKYNDWANRKLLEAIYQIPEKDEAVRLFSHLIASLDKWINRITKKFDDYAMDWFGPVLQLNELEEKWSAGINWWIELIEKTPESELDKDVIFKRVTDGKKLAVKLSDLMLQLNYHSIHHRAQINSIISKQGVKPPATDYIFTVLREV